MENVFSTVIRKKWLPGMPGLPLGARITIGVVLPLLFGLLQWQFWSWLQPAYFLLFFPAVAIAALLSGFCTGLLATAVSALLARACFIPFGTANAAFQLVVFGLDGLLISGLTGYLVRRFRGVVTSQLAETLTRMHDGFFSLDSDLRYVFVNDAGARMLGVDARDALGKCPWEVSPQLQATELPDRLRRLAREGAAEVFPMHFVPEERWLEVAAYPTSQGMSLFVVDVSEKTQARLALERKSREALETNNRLRWANAELERSNADLAQFAHVASHDMKEPLRMISTYVQMLERHYGPQLDDNARMFIGFATQGAKRLHALLNDILAHSKVQSEPISLRPTDLALCIKEAIEQVSLAIAESGAQVSYGPLPSVPCDQRQMTRVLQNLIANAIKFRRPERKPVVTITAVERDAAWEVIVQDNGIGVEDTQRERIFELFKRGHSQERYPGSGIGLATCKRIVERLDGKIWMTPSPDGGSCFHFTIAKNPSRVRLSEHAKPAEIRTRLG